MRTNFSISLLTGPDATVRNGKRWRFRARRTRLEITTSLSGPVPLSHSPDWLRRSSTLIGGMENEGRESSRVQFVLEGPDAVADLGRFFEVLALDDRLEIALEPDELILLSDLRVDRLRGLSRVRRRAVDLLEEPDELRPEDFIVVRAPQSRLALELGIRDAALGAAELARLRGRRRGRLHVEQARSEERRVG